MKIKSLANVSIEQIVDCLLVSFENYFVPMPKEVAFWSQRFHNARVDKSLSWGVFENQDLVGFVINAIDYDKGLFTAFNTGTGVIPQFRGRRLVDKMYAYGLPELKAKGIQCCTLEVIDKNDRAIRVYERIGFVQGQQLFCYKGSIPEIGKQQLEEVGLERLEQFNADEKYSWDNKLATISKAGSMYKNYLVYEQADNSLLGYFIINPENGYLAQLELDDEQQGVNEGEKWASLFRAIAQVNTAIRINNIREDSSAILIRMNMRIL